MNAAETTEYFSVVVHNKPSGEAFVVLDLTVIQLNEMVVKQFLSGGTLLVSGAPIAAAEVKSVQIFCADRAAPDRYNHILNARIENAARTGKLTSDAVERMRPSAIEVARAGSNATNHFITRAPALRGAPAVPLAKNPREVFVAHGRNVKAHDAMFEFLKAVGLEPQDFGDYDSKAGDATPYVGEVLDAAFAQAQAILVLMTPDDEAQLKIEFRLDDDPKYESELQGQARPNVLFEAGMAFGRQQKRTILVQLGVIRPFSDVGGRHILRLDNTAEARLRLVKRLQAAGCPATTDASTGWIKAGDFDGAVPDIFEHLFDD